MDVVTEMLTTSVFINIGVPEKQNQGPTYLPESFNAKLDFAVH